ncbi:hypothetical protein SDRG_03179 [Saprolegnia diclina VS20]|uniref:Uncharacterized protein n=1 Tax=Saprolegnia diclina (strain VS20) TaxID=1156394 RepID=T0S3V3_SAPDV|nr:hypothetical protein SDRG_03179 [Saprolegnia diclina VS20]EQC39753.1 hypothetical protein SDRG_03179 [Saprolegnia diclina VS20]|eukprot:XP_008607025.1 hypothetical protein SDRG_03179 [Saprolegnia diclina VS20]
MPPKAQPKASFYASLPRFDVHNNEERPTRLQQERLAWELVEAATTGNLKQLLEAVQHRADLDCRYNGCTPLYYAAKHGFTPLVRCLLSYGARVETRNLKARTALMIAASRGHFETVLALLHAGAKPTTKDAAGETARLLALRNGHPDVVDALDMHAHPAMTRAATIALKLQRLHQSGR